MRDRDEVRYSATLFDKIIKGASNYEEGVSYNLDELKNSIRENIESILNSRSQVNITHASSQSGRKNMFYYGLSDYSLQNLSDAKVAEEFAKEAKKAIENFEPRLKNIVISFSSQNKDNKNSSFNLKISAELKQEGLKKNDADLAFNTTLIPIKRLFDIDILK